MAGAQIAWTSCSTNESSARTTSGVLSKSTMAETVVRFSFWCDKSLDHAEEGDHEEGV